MKPITVYAYVDPYTTMHAEDMADSLGLDSPEDYEYGEIEAAIKLEFPEVIFNRGVLFSGLANANPDFYVFDIGGMCRVDFGGTQRVGWCHHVLRAMDDHPQTGFVPWSMMTWQAARSAIDDLVLGDTDEVPDGYTTPGRPNLYLPPKAADFECNFSDAVKWMKSFVESRR